MGDAGAGGAGRGAGFERWLAELQVDEAARARARRHWMRSAAEEDASLAGVLLDLAERDVPVTITTVADRRHRGTIAVVGADFIALGATTGRYVLLRTSAVVTVRPTRDAVGPVGDRTVTSAGTLDDVLVTLAAERSAVSLVVGPTESIAGEVRSVGQDVVVLRCGGEPATTAYVALDRVAEVALEGPPDQSLAFESG